MADDVNIKPVDDIEANKLRWKNRRRMAWLSLISMIVITILILFTELASVERMKVLADVVTWYYFTSTSIIGFYVGATTWAHMKK